MISKHVVHVLDPTSNKESKKAQVVGQTVIYQK